MINGNEYQKLAARTIDSNLTNYGVRMHALHGMVGEVGEIHGIFQKRFQGHEIDSNHLMKEIGDLMWFVAEFCTSMGWSLEDVMQCNIDKLRKRYPNGFEIDRSLNREEGDI